MVIRNINFDGSTFISPQRSCRTASFYKCLWLFPFGGQGELQQRTPTIVICPGRLGPVIFQRNDIKLLQNFFQKRKNSGKFPWAVCRVLLFIQLQIGQGTMDRACIMSELYLCLTAQAYTRSIQITLCSYLSGHLQSSWFLTHWLNPQRNCELGI